MPNRDGVAVVQMVLAADPHARLLVMTTYDGDEDIFRCLSQGAKGYLLKDAPRTEILSAIRAVSEDRPYASSSVASKALQRMAKPSLTQRELGVLQLLAEGRSNKDIARRLSITEGTAKTHVKAILTKLDAISRTEAGAARTAQLAVLLNALNDKHVMVVARAATLAGERLLHELSGDLVYAYARLLKDPVKRDPGCKAKQAIARALVTLECQDLEFYRAGIVYRQLEPAW